MTTQCVNVATHTAKGPLDSPQVLAGFDTGRSPR